MAQQRFVIVGGGLAAATAAEELRVRGFDGELRIVASESHLPYLRPPLTKGFLTGAEARDSVFVHPGAWYGEHEVHLETGVSATGIDLGAHRVALSAGRDLAFDRLLLATGASPRTLDVPGADADGVHVLRTLDESEAVKAALAAGGLRIVVIGTGWIGLELASAARGYGNDVTVVGRSAIPLSGAVGEEMGRMFVELQRQNGVVFAAPAGIRSITVQGGRATAVVTDAATLPADLVIVAVGAEPRLELAAGAGLDLDDGVLVDEHLRSSDSAVFAVGDIANAWHPVIRQRMRNEHWANAIGSAKVAAAAMLGQEAVFDEIPYFYTDQFDLGMEFSGYPPLLEGSRLVIRGDREAREFIAFWLRDERVVAGMNVNVWDVNEQVQAMIRAGDPVDAERLADSSVDLADLA